MEGDDDAEVWPRVDLSQGAQDGTHLFGGSVRLLVA